MSKVLQKMHLVVFLFPLKYFKNYVVYLVFICRKLQKSATCNFPS